MYEEFIIEVCERPDNSEPGIQPSGLTLDGGILPPCIEYNINDNAELIND